LKGFTWIKINQYYNI